MGAQTPHTMQGCKGKISWALEVQVRGASLELQHCWAGSSQNPPKRVFVWLGVANCGAGWLLAGAKAAL